MLLNFYHTSVRFYSDEMDFEVGTDTRTGKLIARRVVRLPTGTVSFESISEDRLLGKVDCEPKIITGVSPSENSRRGSKVRYSKNLESC